MDVTRLLRTSKPNIKYVKVGLCVFFCNDKIRFRLYWDHLDGVSVGSWAVVKVVSERWRALSWWQRSSEGCGIIIIIIASVPLLERSCFHEVLSTSSILGVSPRGVQAKLCGWRSDSTVRSQVRRGRPGGRLQSLGSPRIDAVSALLMSSEVSVLAICPKKRSRLDRSGRPGGRWYGLFNFYDIQNATTTTITILWPSGFWNSKLRKLQKMLRGYIILPHPVEWNTNKWRDLGRRDRWE